MRTANTNDLSRSLPAHKTRACLHLAIEAVHSGKYQHQIFTGSGEIATEGNMEEIIDKLADILEQLAAYHGAAQDIPTFMHVKQLHKQARTCIAELRRLAKRGQD